MKPTLESLETIRRGAGIPMQEVIGLFPFFMQNLDAVMFDCDGESKDYSLLICTERRVTVSLELLN